MKIEIQSLHFTAQTALTTFVTEKVNKLSLHDDAIIAAHVILKLDNSTTNENKVCEIILSVPGNDLFAKRQCESFEEATLQVIDALEEQIRKLHKNHFIHS